MSHNWPSYMGHYQPPSTDLQKPNPNDTDGQPPDAERGERSRELRPENPEVSNSASKEEISSELSDADSRVVHSNQAVETDSKVEGNQAFTMRELLNDLREQDQRMLNPSSLDDQKAIANLAINAKDAKVVARSEIKWIAEVAAGGLGNLKVGEAYQDVFDGDNEGRRSDVRRAFDPGGDRSRQAYVISDSLFIASWFPP